MSEGLPDHSLALAATRAVADHSLALAATQAVADHSLALAATRALADHSLALAATAYEDKWADPDRRISSSGETASGSLIESRRLP